MGKGNHTLLHRRTTVTVPLSPRRMYYTTWFVPAYTKIRLTPKSNLRPAWIGKPVRRMSI
jgi:hypothetical protein